MSKKRIVWGTTMVKREHKGDGALIELTVDTPHIILVWAMVYPLL